MRTCALFSISAMRLLLVSLLLCWCSQALCQGNVSPDVSPAGVSAAIGAPGAESVQRLGAPNGAEADNDEDEEEEAAAEVLRAELPPVGAPPSAAAAVA